MAYQSEAELENLLIKQLGEEGYEEIEVKDYPGMVQDRYPAGRLRSPIRARRRMVMICRSRTWRSLRTWLTSWPGMRTLPFQEPLMNGWSSSRCSPSTKSCPRSCSCGGPT